MNEFWDLGANDKVWIRRNRVGGEDVIHVLPKAPNARNHPTARPRGRATLDAAFFTKPAAFNLSIACMLNLAASREPKITQMG